MNYSICFKSEAGHTQRSEFSPFKSDNDAILYGRKCRGETSIVEVWKGDSLLIRLEGKSEPSDVQA